MQPVRAQDKIIIAKKKIELENFPGAFNPSIIRVHDGFLLTFRYCPDPYYLFWISHIGIVRLNEQFEQISKPQILVTRPSGSTTPSQTEDARIFSYKERLFLIYNDNLTVTSPSLWDRRDMFIAELFYINDQFTLSTPLKLVHKEKYDMVLWQKNWLPFVWNNTLLLSYAMHPQEILYPNLKSGECYRLYETYPDITWNYGKLRGSSPPLLVDGEYLAFFHSGIFFSLFPNEEELWYYFMGAYTFSADPPFTITKMTASPIMEEGFYFPGAAWKKVIFPGGYVVSDAHIFMAYGRNDCEVWIATIDKQALKKALLPIK
jgi:predicted GH43/DUF377 family glycosyl hydrolase